MKGKSVAKRSICVIISLIIALSILTLLANQSQSVLAQSQKINLIDNKHVWKPFFDTNVTQNQSKLHIVVESANYNKIYSRAFLPMQIQSDIIKPLILNLSYVSQSIKGNATFGAEIRGNIGSTGNGSSMILWHKQLNNTNGQSSNATFNIPSGIVNRPVELRLYAISNGPGMHILDVKNATMMIR